MDDLIEFLLDLVLEGSIELSPNKKVPKPIGYVLTSIVGLFFIAVLFLIFFCAVMILEESVFAGILILGIGLFILIGGIKKVHKAYFEKKKKEREEKERNSDIPIKF